MLVFRLGIIALISLAVQATANAQNLLVVVKDDAGLVQKADVKVQMMDGSRRLVPDDKPVTTNDKGIATVDISMALGQKKLLVTAYHKKRTSQQVIYYDPKGWPASVHLKVELPDGF